MKILLTNDDGIGAPGIRALWQSLSDIADLTVAAPDAERSATSQAITVHHPIRVDSYRIEELDIPAWRVGGTPTDCVKIALEALLSEPPDLVVSGINQGPNLGTDVLYSGTVSAAIEAALHGVKAVAVSLDAWHDCDYQAAAAFVRSLVPTITVRSLPPDTLLNVNVPNVPAKALQGVMVTKLGVRQYENVFDRRVDPRGRTYYWMGGQIMDSDNDSDTDVMAVLNNYISVTPIHFDLTNYTIIDMLKEWPLSHGMPQA